MDARNQDRDPREPPEVPPEKGASRRTQWLYAALGVGLAALLVGAGVFYVLTEGGDVPTSTTESAPVPPGTPVMLYSVAAQEGQPFRPRGAAIVEGKAYVADSEGARVAVLDLEQGEGASLTFIPLAPGRPGEPLPAPPQPTAVASLPDGNLAVTDASNGRIWKVGRDGSFLGDLVPEQERRRSELETPVGLGATESQLYVTDVGDHAVKVFTHTGRFVRRLGGQGFRPGQMSFPNGVAAAGDRVYVADSNNGRVQVLAPDGTPLFLLEEGASEEALRLPRSLALDRSGRLHVVDTFARTVLLFQEDVPAGSYGGGDDGEALGLPEGIAISADRIVVSDSERRRLTVFSY